MSAVELNIKVCDFCPVASRWGNHEYAPTCGEEPHDFSAASMYLFFSWSIVFICLISRGS